MLTDPVGQKSGQDKEEMAWLCTMIFDVSAGRTRSEWTAGYWTAGMW